MEGINRALKQMPSMISTTRVLPSMSRPAVMPLMSCGIWSSACTAAYSFMALSSSLVAPAAICAAAARTASLGSAMWSINLAHRLPSPAQYSVPERYGL